MKERDYSLDAIKGFACIFMVLAHVWWSSWTNIVVAKLSFFGNFAPLLFYAVTGVTSTFQAKKTPFKVIIVFYTMFALLGFSFSAASNSELFYTLGSDLCNVPQIIAISAIVIIFIEKYFKPKKKFYILASIFIYLIHYLIYTKMSVRFMFPFWPFIFASQGADNLFSVVPWISFFFLGIYAQYSKNKHNLFMGVFSLLLLIGYEVFIYIKYPGKLNGMFNKFSMDTGYFMLCGCILFLSFFIFKNEKYLYFQNKILLYLGKYSLLFLYVHLMIFDTLRAISHYVFKNDSPNAYIAWISVFVFSLIVMKIFQNINRYFERFFNHFFTWLFLLITILVIAIVSHYVKDLRYTEYLLGVLFACNYQNLSSLLKQKFSIATK